MGYLWTLMRVTVREAAALLQATEQKVYAWIESGDLPTLRRAAHTMKGSLVHLAAPQAIEIAEQMEFLARQQKLAEAAALWPQLKAELDRIAPALAEFAKQPC
jgi:excisionase family DNA binding protein